MVSEIKWSPKAVSAYTLRGIISCICVFHQASHTFKVWDTSAPSQMRKTIPILVNISVLEYLQEEFSPTEVNDFIVRVDKKLTIMQSPPRIGWRTKKKQIFRTLVHKKVSLIYKYISIKKEIQLVIFWNNAQHTAKLKY